MSLVRLLALAFVLCSLSVLAQEQTKTPPSAVLSPTIAAVVASNAAPTAEPKSSVDQIQSGFRDQKLSQDDVNKFLSDKTSSKTKPAGINEESSNDRACLYIRSYVVARDSKDSDSTHLVSYSTCQPGSRYGLKTTYLKQNSPSH